MPLMCGALWQIRPDCGRGVLAVTDLNEAIVPAPAVRIDNSFEFVVPADNRLQRGFGASGRKASVYGLADDI
jgi:hypothetical protein